MISSVVCLFFFISGSGLPPEPNLLNGPVEGDQITGAHLHGVDPLILSDLADRFDSLQCLQGDSCLKLGTVDSSLFLHGLLVGYATPKPYHIITTPLAPFSGTASVLLDEQVLDYRDG